MIEDKPWRSLAQHCYHIFSHARDHGDTVFGSDEASIVSSLLVADDLEAVQCHEAFQMRNQ